MPAFTFLADNISKREHLQHVASTCLEMNVVCQRRRLQSIHRVTEMLFMFNLMLWYNHLSECEHKHEVVSDLFTAFLFWPWLSNRQMKSGCNERQCYSEDGPISPLNLVTKILQGIISVNGGQPYLFSWQRPAFQEQTMVSGLRSSVVIEY